MIVELDERWELDIVPWFSYPSDMPRPDSPWLEVTLRRKKKVQKKKGRHQTFKLGWNGRRFAMSNEFRRLERYEDVALDITWDKLEQIWSRP